MFGPHPSVLKQPGFLNATKFRRADASQEMAEYWTVYEIESMSAFERYNSSAEAKRLRADHQSRYGARTKLERFALVKTFEASSTR